MSSGAMRLQFPPHQCSMQHHAPLQFPPYPGCLRKASLTPQTRQQVIVVVGCCDARVRGVARGCERQHRVRACE
jgi:hypothetical protein